MSFFRSFLLNNRALIIGLISLILSAALFFLGSLMGYEEFRGGYAVLAVDISVDDRMLNSSLNEELAFSGDVISESNQFVILDNFDSFEVIPLDKYHTRIFSFDPRNDGYAEKLRKVFVDNDKRFFYIPLKAGNWNAITLDKQFASLLGDIPFTAEYFGIGRPLFLFFGMYAAAAVCMLIICLLMKKYHHGVFDIIALVPVLFSLAFFGAPGIVCAALFIALFIMLKEPFSELVSAKSPLKNKLKSINKSGKNRFKLYFKDIIIPYRFYFLITALFAAAFVFIAIFSQLKVFFLLVVFFTAFAVFLFSLKLISLEGGKHRKFIPVMIIKSSLPEFTFPVYMLPFAASAVLTMFFIPYMSGSYVSNYKFDTFIEEQDYLAHLAFQSSFSVRPLGKNAGLQSAPAAELQTGEGGEGTSQSGGPNRSVMPAFFADTDRLPSLKVAKSGHAEKYSDFPPFPGALKDLMHFFHNVNSGEKTNSDSPSGEGLISNRFKDIISLLVLLLFILTGFIFNRNNNNSADKTYSKFKGIFQKFRVKYINWNKTSLYRTARFTVQKDA